MKWIKSLVFDHRIKEVDEDFKSAVLSNGVTVRFNPLAKEIFKQHLIDYIRANYLEKIKSAAYNQLDFDEEYDQTITVDDHPIQIGESEIFVNAEVSFRCVSTSVYSDYYYPGDAAEFEADQIEIELCEY